MRAPSHLGVACPAMPAGLNCAPGGEPLFTEGFSMKNATRTSLAVAAGLAATVSTVAIAPAQGVVDNIAKNDSVFVDGKSFNVVTGKSKGDTPTDVRRLGARELGAGALIFRSQDK